MAEWRFPSSDFGEIKGINDSGITMFKSDPLTSLAREICQNSLDAATDKTVKIEFNIFKIPSNEMPGREYLEDVFNKCLDYWKILKDNTVKEFFKNGIKKLQEEEIEFLRISDFNTTGLTGSHQDINTNWTNLIKSSGASDKNGTAGGSFGIGKFAPFACSDFSTVFYSTYDCENEKAYQGVSRLVTFTTDDNDRTQGVGYYGEEKNTPVFEELKLDHSFNRSDKQYGTDIYIAGYRFNDENWKKDIIVSILNSFLGAIWHEKLELNIGGVIINKNELGNIIEEYKNDIKRNYTDKYYELLVSDGTHWFIEDDFNGLGEVKLGLILDDKDAPNRVSMIRKTGMKIRDKDRLGCNIPITGIMFINGDEINKQLRAIENPEHTKWEPKRAKNRHKASALVNSLYDFIKEKIGELISSGAEESVDAVGVGAFLPDDPDDSRNQTEEETVSARIMDVEIKEVKKISMPQSTSGDNEADDANTDDGSYEQGGNEEEWFHSNGHTYESKEKPGQPAHTEEGGNDSKSSRINVGIEKLTCMAIKKNEGIYMIRIVPKKDGTNGEVSLFLSAETDKYEAPIKKAFLNGMNELVVEQNVIKGLEFNKGKEFRLKIELDYYDYCSMEVILNAVAK